MSETERTQANAMNRRADQFRPLFAQLGERVRRARTAQNLTLEEVGYRAGLTKSYVWSIERGQSSNPTVSAVWGLASALSVSPYYLLGMQAEESAMSPLAARIAAIIDQELVHVI